MTDNDGDSRRRRLRELRDGRGAGNDVSDGAGDDNARIDRARAERSSSTGGGAADARFPRLREAFQQRRQGGGGGQAGGRPAWGQDPDAKKPPERVMFARRLPNSPAEDVADDPLAQLQSLERRIERLQVELDSSVEQLTRLKQSLKDQGGLPTDSGAI